MAHYDWAGLYGAIEKCEACALAKTRRNVVIGDGNPHSGIMLIGEGPGHDEDVEGLPFVGAAGKLLDKMLASIELDRSKVYIGNIVKCRPPENRTPLDEECNACLPYLRAQTALIMPKLIVCLGRTAARYVYDENVRITRDRGEWKCKKGVWIIPTYHPAALLRDQSKKYEAWEDMKSIRTKLDELKKTEQDG